MCASIFFLIMVAVWWNVNKQTDSNTYSSACSSVKRYHKALPQDATSNGGDASRVGQRKEKHTNSVK